MKKTILAVIAILMVAALTPLETYAAGGFGVSTQNITLHPGESTSFSVTASDSAGKINLSSSDADVASVNLDGIFLDMDSEDIIVTANSVGTATILVVASSNFATYDEEILEGQSYMVTVKVTEEEQADNDSQDAIVVDDENNTETIDSVASTPNTGNNSQANDSSNQIILSSIIGASVAIVSFVVIYLYNYRKRTR